MAIESKLLDVGPSDQNIVDLFQGEWSSRMPGDLVAEPGHAELFADHRLHWANGLIGPFADLDVLELGPLEGAHATLLEGLGARSVTSIEANPRAFLKCLCVKELFGLTRTRFKLGSFLPYLETCGRFDAVIACGVLYHMAEPLRLLDLITARTDRVFLWTHVHQADIVATRADRALFWPPLPIGGTPYRGARRLYPDVAKSWQGFSGGGESHAVWLERDSLLAYFRDRGFTVTIDFDEPDHVNGPALALCARR